MRFEMIADARAYYDSLKRRTKFGSIKTRLEFYWLCCIIGFLDDRDDVEYENSIELVDNFTQALEPHADLIRAMAFYFYFMGQGGEISDRAVLKAMNDFFTEKTLTKLSDEGFKILNEKAAKGFHLIKKIIPQPENLAAFLLSYLDLLNLLLSRGGWN